MSFKERSIREVKAMAEFDYNALAELFPSRGRMRQRQSFGYKRFAPQYLIKNRSELHERVVGETDLIPSKF